MFCTEGVSVLLPSLAPGVSMDNHLRLPPRWVFHTLEAELTTFELFKTPVDELLDLIAQARSRSIGVVMPEVSAPTESR